MTTPQESTLIPQVVRTYFALVSAFEKSVGIHIARWRILYVLNKIGPCAQKDISRRTFIDPAAMSRILKEFEQEGLIRRSRSDEDGRRVVAALTPRGKSTVRRLRKARGAFLQSALDGFSASEIETLQELLQRVHDSFHGQIARDSQGELPNPERDPKDTW